MLKIQMVCSDGLLQWYRFAEVEPFPQSTFSMHDGFFVLGVLFRPGGLCVMNVAANFCLILYQSQGIAAL